MSSGSHAAVPASCRVTALFVALLFGGSASAAEVTVVKADGEEVTGRLQSIDAARGIVVAGKLAALRDIAEVRFHDVERASAKGKASVRLRNDDCLFVTVTSGDDKALKVVSGVLGELTLKNETLKGLSFPIKSPPSRAALDGFFGGADPKRDQMLTPKGEVVEGFMASFTDTELVFDTDGQERKIPFEGLAAFRYCALDAMKPVEGIIARVRLSDGSELSGGLSGYADSSIVLAGAQGSSWKIPDAAVQAVLFKGGRLVYLSDLKPKVEEKPYVGGAPVVLGWRGDSSVIGERLRIGKKEYARGLGVRSYCRLSFDLEGAYDHILTDVGMDASAASQAACSWKIVADGKELAAGDAKAGEAPKRLKLSVAGAKAVDLICDYGPDQDDSGDHLKWAGARLLKK